LKHAFLKLVLVGSYALIGTHALADDDTGTNSGASSTSATSGVPMGPFTVSDANSGPVSSSGAAGVAMGPAIVYFSLGGSAGYDDNLWLSNASQKSSAFETVTPGIRLETRDSNSNLYSLNYQANLGRYNNSTADNYEDQQLIGNADLHFSTRSNLILTPEYLIGHDQRGTTYGVFVSEPNRWHTSGISGIYAYGSEGSQGRIEISAGYLNTIYENNRFLTTAYDKTIANVGATFYYRVMPKTSLLFQVTDSHVMYNQDTLSLSGTQQKYLVGATWEATASTTGVIKVGELHLNFDSPVYHDFTGMSWEGNVLWSPLSYTHFKFLASRSALQTTLAGSSFMLNTTSSVDWAHDWSERFVSHVNYTHVDNNFEGSGASLTTNSYGLGIDYKMRRWLKAGLSWQGAAQNADQPVLNNFIYNRNLYMLTLTGTL
jgi:hypothetical protein